MDAIQNTAQVRMQTQLIRTFTVSCLPGSDIVECSLIYLHSLLRERGGCCSFIYRKGPSFNKLPKAYNIEPIILNLVYTDDNSKLGKYSWQFG